MKVLISLLVLLGVIFLYLTPSESTGVVSISLPLSRASILVITDEERIFLMKLALGLLILLGIIYWSFRDWRRGVKAVFFILVIDGALRKWVLPQADEFIYFLKDFVLLGAYIRFYLFPKNEVRYGVPIQVTTILIFVASGWCIFQAFNPHLGSPIVGFLGIKAYLFYIPMIGMMPSLFRTEEELYIFLRNHLFLLIPVGILGIVQFFSPINSPINQYIPGRDQAVATFGFAGSKNVRITSTFSYLNSYQGYLSASFGLIVTVLFKKQERRWQIITFCEVFLLALNGFMTGSRTPIIAAILFLMGFLGLRTLKQPEKVLLWLTRLLPFLAIAVALAFFLFRPVVDAFWNRVTTNSDLTERISMGFMGPFTFANLTGFDGYGTGATHPGAGALRNLFKLPPGTFIPIEIEPEMGKIALELGPLGFMFWYTMRIGIIIHLWVIYTQLKRPFLRDLALAGFLIQTILIINQMVFHHTFSIYYWFYSSFIVLLPWLERVENWREAQWRIQQTYEETLSFPDSSHR